MEAVKAVKVCSRLDIETPSEGDKTPSSCSKENELAVVEPIAKRAFAVRGSRFLEGVEDSKSTCPAWTRCGEIPELDGELAVWIKGLGRASRMICLRRSKLITLGLGGKDIWRSN